MEPLAPGTEDEPICNQDIKLSKKDAAEEVTLAKKAFLPNGTYGNIFLLEYVEGAQNWFCRVCERPVFGRIFNHEIGKRHLSRLKLGRNEDVPNANGNEDDYDEAAGMSMVVAPGEPLPPGFEEEIETKTLIQDRLDKFNSIQPLVGLEYLLELLDYDPSKEPLYMCILCHKKGDPRTILTHLASYNHQVMYLQKHFPTAYRHIAPYMIKVYKRNWQSGLQKIAEAIESTFGRLKPMQVEANKFNKDQMYYIGLVAKGKHFSELSGHTFENIVTKEELTKVHEEPVPKQPTPTPVTNVQKRRSPSPPVVAKPVKRAKPLVEEKNRKRSLSPISDVSSSDLEDFNPRSPKKFSKLNESVKKKERSEINTNKPLVRKDYNMPWQKSTYKKDRPQTVIERNKDERTEKIEEFKRLAKAIDNQMEIVLKKHKENPEKHPKYNDEWKKFWNTRYKELQAEGKNAAAHDFKPEWIEFWNKRMQELHQEEIKTSKMALRKRLDLPEEPAPISFKIRERRKVGDAPNRPIPTAAQPDNDPEVIIIDDNDDDTIPRTKFRNTRKSKSPIRRDAKSPQFRRRSPTGRSRDFSPPSRRKESPPCRRKESSPPWRKESPPSRRKASPYRRRDSPSHRRRNSSPPYSPPKIRDSPKRQLSPLSCRKSSPSALRAPSPPVKRMRDERKHSLSSERERSPKRDRFERSLEKSQERSRSIGKSRELSWERERDRRRDYEEKHWDTRGYRGREAPWERDHHYPIDPYAPPKVLRDVTRKPVLTEKTPDEDDGNVNIVAVLRVLTALEEKLGSLGPKVIDLLAQALAMEKKMANSSEELLDSDVNCVLFETVKEKLKGQLQAGLVDWNQEKAFKIAITKTASLIHVASQRKKQKEEELPKKPVVVPGIGKVDKGKIARQIANALIAQGKTDVTQNELEELINAVVGIAEAQKNTSETVTTASFLEKLSNSQAQEKKADTSKPGILKSEPKEEQKEDEKESIPNIEEDLEASSSSQDKTTLNMEGLSDSDLETLLQNFKDLSSDEQLGLINYLKKLEAKEPERVEKLRKFVNLSENTDENNESGRYSPFSARMETSNLKTADVEKKEEEKQEDTSGFINIDSEDEYSFEDVAKAVSQKVIENEREQKKMEDKNLDDAKAFITSLMSSLNKNVSNPSPATTVPSSAAANKKNSTDKITVISNIAVNPVSSADIAKSLSNITMSVSSLGNILGNIQNLTNKSPVEQQEPKQQQIQTTSVKPNDFPLVNPPALKSSYNEFDISSQRDLRSKPDFNAPEVNKNRPNKSYDEFNIGPFTRDGKEEQREFRLQGPSGNRLPDKQGFPDLSNSSYQDKFPQLDRNTPFANMQGPPRGAIQERPTPPFSNQYPPRGGNFANKLRPGSNNFELGAGRADFVPRNDDFRVGVPQRGGINDHRGPIADQRGGTNDRRGPMPDQRGGLNDHRGPMPDQRAGLNDQRGGTNDQRGAMAGQRGLLSNQRGGITDHRGGIPDQREGLHDQRGGIPDLRSGIGNFRGMTTDYRGGSNDFRDGPMNFRNDFRGDMRGGNFQGDEETRFKEGDFRGGYGYPRGGNQPQKGGNYNNTNRANNFAPPSRYPGSNNSNFNNFNKW